MATENEVATATEETDSMISDALAELSGVTSAETSDESDDLLQTETDDAESDDQPDEESEESDEESEDEADDEEESDEDSEDEADDEEEEAEEHSDNVQKRINKLTAQKKSAIEELEKLKVESATSNDRLADLEAKAENFARPVLGRSPASPLEDVLTSDELNARIESAHKVRDWALVNADGAAITGADGEERFVEAEDVRKHFIAADRLLNKFAPARAKWIASKEQSLAATKEAFPEILKKGTSMNAAYHATIKEFPELLGNPHSEFWAGCALLGEQVLIGKQKAAEAKSKASKKVSARKDTPSLVRPSSSSKSANKNRGTKAARDKVLSSGGSINDLENYMSERLF